MIHVPCPRREFDFTEQPEWRLEDRFQDLTEKTNDLIGERREQVIREMGHIAFELKQRSTHDEPIYVVQH